MIVNILTILTLISLNILSDMSDTMDKGYIQFGDSKFNLESTRIYGIYENEQVNWFIELFPSSEENYIMFNGLNLEITYLLKGFNEITYTSIDSDLYEHTLYVDNEEKFLKSLSFKIVETEKDNLIQISGIGTIEPERKEKAINIEFDTICEFAGIYLLETNEIEINQFIEEVLKKSMNEIELETENVPSGLKCLIRLK